MHKMILYFLELKEDEMDTECYRCESMVSFCECVSDSYRVRFEKIEEYIESK